MGALHIHTTGELLVAKDALLLKGIYTEGAYRTSKSRGAFQEIDVKEDKYVILKSLPAFKQKNVHETFKKISSEYSQLLQSMDASGIDYVPTAIEFTAETLQINEPFIRSAIETYMNTHYTIYTWAYLDAGLHSDSVKGYSKQCALVQWIADFAKKIETSEADVKCCELMMRSFRANLLTALQNVELEVKIPLSETRFNKWFDDILKQIELGNKPEDIIQIKRQRNANANKVTDEQIKVAEYFHINGTNMSVAQVYLKWIKYGKEHGWWLENGNFNPPTEGRLYQLLRPLKNAHLLAKSDAITHRANAIPSISRLLPEKKNHVWAIDGTAHNENVKHGSKVRQHVYTIKVADVATLRLLGASSLIGVREPFEAVRDAILMGIKKTGYKPAIIQCDRGPAWTELEVWCKANDIKLYPAITGNARAKSVIESLFRMFDNDITRFLKGFSGMNRTALHLNSTASDKRETEGKKNARSASIAMGWIENEGITLWNERIIKQLEGVECNKTPFELWDEKESFSPQLSYVQLAQLCGTLHQRKLTIEGLDIQHQGQTYTYFPPIGTKEQREVAERIFTYIPLDAQTSNRLNIYVLNGGEPAPVYDHEGKYLGIWELKQRAAYIATTKEEKELLDNYSALQYRIERRAKEINTEVTNYISKHPNQEVIEALGNEMLTGRRRRYEGFAESAKAWCGRYDKSALLQEEQDAKADDVPVVETRKFKELVDPDTGEIFQIEIN